jgi:hypothetical protein
MSVTLYRNVYRFADGETVVADVMFDNRLSAATMGALFCLAHPDARPAYLLVIKPRLELARA